MEPLITVVVTLKTGTTIKGALVEAAPNALILRAASLANDENRRITWVKLDGDVVLPMDNIDFYQTSADPAVLG